MFVKLSLAFMWLKPRRCKAFFTLIAITINYKKMTFKINKIIINVII